jgi:hypothetical protein
MYAHDNNGVLLPNAPFNPPSPGAKAWVDVSTTAYVEGLANQLGNTNRTLYTSGLLAPYLANQVGVYRSPGDRMPSANGQRIRSYSMNGQMGCVYIIGKINFDKPAIQYVRESQIVNPGPSSMFVFCEEDPYTINDGFLEIFSQLSAPGFPDVPGAYLDGACAFSFADGHAEIHKWRTGVLTNARGPISYIPGGAVHNEDWVWFTQHAAVNP